MQKATLVLEGGATRGVFTSGVLDYLMEQEFYTSHVIGVSAGACNVLVYSSNSCLVTIWALIVLQTNPNNIIKIIFFMLT